MKNMKKIFSFIVCMVFVVVLVSSCGKDVKDKDSSSSYLNSSVSSDSNDSDATDENVNSKESRRRCIKHQIKIIYLMTCGK